VKLWTPSLIILPHGKHDLAKAHRPKFSLCMLNDINVSY
jgi:hypothetical protein